MGLGWTGGSSPIVVKEISNNNALIVSFHGLGGDGSTHDRQRWNPAERESTADASARAGRNPPNPMSAGEGGIVKVFRNTPPEGRIVIPPESRIASGFPNKSDRATRAMLPSHRFGLVLWFLMLGWVEQVCSAEIVDARVEYVRKLQESGFADLSVDYLKSLSPAQRAGELGEQFDYQLGKAILESASNAPLEREREMIDEALVHLEKYRAEHPDTDEAMDARGEITGVSVARGAAAFCGSSTGGGSAGGRPAAGGRAGAAGQGGAGARFDHRTL